jgi:phosphotriesterase-related protein
LPAENWTRAHECSAVKTAGAIDTPRLSRREWLAGALAMLGGCRTPGTPDLSSPGPAGAGRVETVTGPVAADRLGTTLMHEHVLVDFIGAAEASPSRYDADAVFKAVLPYLQQARTLGCDTLVECTPAHLGRDPRLLKRLSEASGVHILSNTGYYGAAKDKHLPAHAFDETAEQLAARWVREHERGIDGTGIKPAFMKIGVDDSPLSAVDVKLVRAAALTYRATGLPIASHTTSGTAALEEMAILEAAGVPLSAFIWVHAHAERDESFHARAARRGSWVEFDGVSPSSVTRHVELVQRMKGEGLLGHVLVSHDAGWYRVGEPGGGQFRPYDTLFTAFVPALKASGFGDGEIRQLLVGNPRRALSPGSVRL